MVTNNLFKSYSSQIAKLFCREDLNKNLCEGAIKERLNSFLDDATYPIFLSKLPSGRVYIANAEEFQDYGYRFVITDIITGERFTAWWEVPYKLPYLSKLPGNWLSHKFNIISANKTFSNENKSDYRIVWCATKTNYGITFVPAQVPGYTPPSSTPGNEGQIITTPDPSVPNVPSVPSSPNNFDFSQLLSNPIYLIGGAVVLYFLFKDKF